MKMKLSFYLLSSLILLLGMCRLSAQIPAFPEAEGFGAQATGGRGGYVIHVTNLNISGPGSLQDALNQSGNRYIVFDVSGVINGTVEVPPGHGNFTLAGQTSPAGIIVRGFQSYNNDNPSSGNFIVRHLRSRIGTLETLPTMNWLGSDGLTLGGVSNVIVDHCSFGQANDEAVDISRSSSLTIQNCILSETLGEHSYLGGMLINYASSQSPLDNLSIIKNIWNRIGGRMPEISCESSYCNGKSIHMELSNNLFYDPRIELWYEGVTGSGNFYLKMNAQNNYSYCQESYNNGMFHHDLLHFNPNQLYFSGNKLSKYPGLADYDLFYCCNDFDTNYPNTDFGIAQRLNQRHTFPTFNLLQTYDLPSYMTEQAGAFPRDDMDSRLMSYVRDLTFDSHPIDQEYIQDGFLIQNSIPPFPDTDQDGMPDYWEDSHSLNPNQQDHNGSQLSQQIFGIQGYTNLECYMHCLSDFVINGNVNLRNYCGIQGYSYVNNEPKFTETVVHVYPNPVSQTIHIRLNTQLNYPVQAIIFDVMGRQVKAFQLSDADTSVQVEALNGTYFIQVGSVKKRFVVIR